LYTFITVLIVVMMNWWCW